MYQDIALVENHRRLLLRKTGASVELTEVINAVFDSLMTHIRPRFSAFAALFVAISAFQKKDFGIFPEYEVVWLPTIVIDEDGMRYRTEIMQIVYEAVVPICVSELSRHYLQTTLRLHGLQILFLCNGSFLLGAEKHIRAFGESFEHIRREKIYSTADTHRYPIRMIDSFESVLRPSIDLSSGGSEKRLFQDIEKMLNML